VNALEGFTETSFTHDGRTRSVYRAGTGPGVIVMHEMPGLTPRVAEFGRKVAGAGFTAVLPVLFGNPGQPMSVGYVAREISKGCVSREFTVWATRQTSPVIEWLRALARDVHAECGGRGVGAVGMCFTGGFALGMAVDASLAAPVLSQPSLPFPMGRARASDLGVSDADLARVKERARDEGLCVLGLRFTGDRAVPAARFARLQRELGDNFIAVEIDSSPGNVFGIPKMAHSVLTEHFVDEPGHPTRDALERVLEFLRRSVAPERRE
jgi:dienelactone hydrolase